MINLSEHNFSSVIDCDYDITTDCESWGCDTICRCSSISNEVVNSVNVESISKFIYELYFDNSVQSNRNIKIDSLITGVDEYFNFYTIDRILRINKIYDSSSWDINVTNGYYGDEIESVNLKEDIAEKIQNQLSVIFDVSNFSDRVKYLLKLEYGYILNDLKELEFHVEEVDKSLIYFGSKNHQKNVSEKYLEFYNDINYSLIRGVVIKSDNRYRLIDGYHRCSKTNKNKIKLIVGTL